MIIMGISIKNDEVERVIRQMADKTGLPITESIHIAVKAWLASHEDAKAADEAHRRKPLDDIVGRIRRWPVYDDRDHGEMLYDRDGLPK